MKVNEVFGPTIQGEGKYIGTPSFFVRSSGCNLRCSWLDRNDKIVTCDTPYTSFFQDNVSRLNYSEFEKKLSEYPNIKHIVLTGGEPLLQSKDVIKFVEYFRTYQITIETNGTIFVEKLAYKNNVYFSISPKLKNSYFAESEKELKRHAKNNQNWKYYVKKTIYATGLDKNKFQLKFVVTSKSDMNEIIDAYNYIFGDYYRNDFTQNVYLMPMGIDNDEINANLNVILNSAYKYGFNITDRLHIRIFGNKRKT
jgi:7-carboxy-7-deazaguanine synthase